jgi:protocatechuate 3,4-dioxygenase alpha subunit
VVFARGLLNRLFTRIYLPDDVEALANDPLLSSLPEDRRRTLIAEREEDGSLKFDIRLQGEDETVFLAYPRNGEAHPGNE